MTLIPHPNSAKIQVNCGVITVSDTRTTETDTSGQLWQQLLQNAGHLITAYTIIPDEPALIETYLKTWCRRPDIDVILFNGGTGISARDTTYDSLEKLLEKTLPGFGELFRWLSYQEIGSRAIASRAVAGVYQGKLIFSVPGSSNAVQLATEKLILPELIHLIKLIKSV